jgi:hypothetical protein
MRAWHGLSDGEDEYLRVSLIIDVDAELHTLYYVLYLSSPTTNPPPSKMAGSSIF